VTAQFTGSAGQSFGAFTVGGMRLILEGEANDYVAKGMAGGEIAILPPRAASYQTPQVIAGNTLLYGATGGALFVAGKVGERFAVRNSGATAVVEGVGDHGCEYMTGGTVVVLGPTGRNFGAGMTNGLAFVYDAQEQFWGRANEDVVLEHASMDDPELGIMRELIERHAKLTHSVHAKHLLANWAETVRKSWKVIPTATIELKRQQEEAEAESETTAGAAD
jgi:glutamate synthase domain-containing protein 3